MTLIQSEPRKKGKVEVRPLRENSMILTILLMIYNSMTSLSLVASSLGLALTVPLWAELIVSSFRMVGWIFCPIVFRKLCQELFLTTALLHCWTGQLIGVLSLSEPWTAGLITQTSGISLNQIGKRLMWRGNWLSFWSKNWKILKLNSETGTGIALAFWTKK